MGMTLGVPNYKNYEPLVALTTAAILGNLDNDNNPAPAPVVAAPVVQQASINLSGQSAGGAFVTTPQAAVTAPAQTLTTKESGPALRNNGLSTGPTGPGNMV